MKTLFEIVDFYPANPPVKKFLGTLQVYIVCGDVQFDIRGINVFKASKGFFITLPHGEVYCQEEKRVIRYPYFAFTNQIQSDSLKNFLLTEGKKYVAQKLTEIENAKKKTPPYRTVERSNDKLVRETLDCKNPAIRKRYKQTT